MDYEELAKRIGTIQGGHPVSALDVEQEFRSKNYVVQGGKLAPSELFRLQVYAKKRTIKRVVDEAFAADAAKAKQKPAPKRDTAQAMRRSELIEKAMTVAPRRPLAMARGVDPLFDPAIQARFKLEAWAGYRAGLIR